MPKRRPESSKETAVQLLQEDGTWAPRIIQLWTSPREDTPSDGILRSSRKASIGGRWSGACNSELLLLAEGADSSTAPPAKFKLFQLERSSHLMAKQYNPAREGIDVTIQWAERLEQPKLSLRFESEVAAADWALTIRAAAYGHRVLCVQCGALGEPVDPDTSDPIEDFPWRGLPFCGLQKGMRLSKEGSGIYIVASAGFEGELGYHAELVAEDGGPSIDVRLGEDSGYSNVNPVGAWAQFREDYRLLTPPQRYWVIPRRLCKPCGHEWLSCVSRSSAVA